MLWFEKNKKETRRGLTLLALSKDKECNCKQSCDCEYSFKSWFFLCGCFICCRCFYCRCFYCRCCRCLNSRCCRCLNRCSFVDYWFCNYRCRSCRRCSILALDYSFN